VTRGTSKRLSDQQRYFVKLYAQGIPQTEAAEKAGYKNAPVSACQLLDSELVQEYLTELRSKSEAETVATLVECQEILTNQIRDPVGNPKDVREAIKVMAQIRGWNITKTEVSGSVTLAQPEMSDAEVRRRLAELAGK